MAIRLQTAIRAIVMSARLHTKSSVATDPKKYHAADQYPVGVEHPFLCGDETDIRFTVIIISQDTAECEEEQRYGNKDASGSTDLIRERLLG